MASCGVPVLALILQSVLHYRGSQACSREGPVPASPRGWSWDLTTWRSRSTNWPGRAWLPHKLVRSWETHMTLHKYVLWQAIKSWEFLSPKDLLLIFLRISAFELRKLLLFESILNGTEMIRMLNSVWFWPRAVFTGWLDIVRPNESSLPTGNRSHPQPLAWLHKMSVLKQ